MALCANLVVYCMDIGFDLFHIMRETPYHLRVVQGIERIYCGITDY